MNEPTRTTLSTTGHGGRKALAMFGAALLIAVTLYASRDTLPPAPVAAAEEPKDKKPAAPTPRAVEAANAFLDALDAKQKEKAQLTFDSDKKPN